eukprot:10713647-Alexandrium_andersonii.AAC.1
MQSLGGARAVKQRDSPEAMRAVARDRSGSWVEATTAPSNPRGQDSEAGPNPRWVMGRKNCTLSGPSGQ